MTARDRIRSKPQTVQTVLRAERLITGLRKQEVWGRILRGDAC